MSGVRTRGLRRKEKIKVALCYVFYNSKSGKRGSGAKDKLVSLLKGEDVQVLDVTKFSGYREELAVIKEGDRIYLVGGDGTLNRFINETDGMALKNDVYYYPSGTGNDFLRDIEKSEKDAPIKINKYITNLPFVDVKGKSYRFLNGIGFGIDGYCCLVGDELKAKNVGDINYTSIAIKGLLFHYHPTDCTITVDGKKYQYKKVWLCPVMNGRYYGGGMMAAPNQKRLNKEGTVTAMLFFGKGKLATLAAFSSIFKGEHVNKKGIVALHSGKDITVEFSRPTPLQIDGETIKDVTVYHVHR